MNKRYIILLLMLVYGLSSTGANLYLHFCCGQLDDVSFTLQHKDGCNGEEEAIGETCCNNVAIDLKLDADQHPTAKWIPSFTEPAALNAALPIWMAPPAVTFYKGSHWANAPPVSAAGLPVYIKNCVFRI